MAIVSRAVNQTHLQLLSLNILEKDLNACRMLTNLKAMKPTILESAMSEGTPQSLRSELLRAAYRDRTQVTPKFDPMRCAAPWKAVDVEVVAHMPGPGRLASVPGTQARPLQVVLDDVDATGDGLMPKKESTRRRGQPKAQKGTKRRRGLREVTCMIEDRDEDSAFKKTATALACLQEKWVGLRIFDADEDNGDGEIVDFEWSPSVREPQWAAVVEFEKGGREAYFFRELPSLVIAAESKQPDDVVLEYEDLPDDDELPGDGERDLMAALDAVRAEED